MWICGEPFPYKMYPSVAATRCMQIFVSLLCKDQVSFETWMNLENSKEYEDFVFFFIYLILWVASWRLREEVLQMTWQIQWCRTFGILLLLLNRRMRNTIHAGLFPQPLFMLNNADKRLFLKLLFDCAQWAFWIGLIRVYWHWEIHVPTSYWKLILLQVWRPKRASASVQLWLVSY